MMPIRSIPPLSGQDELPDYDVCLPANLRPVADMFIRHLHELPYQQHRYCPHCDSSNVYVSKGVQPGFRLPTYRCSSCRKGYNSLTGTPFARLEHMQLWSTFAVYLLAGWPGTTAAPLIGISCNAFYRWVRGAREVMAQEFPELHRWWSARQDRQNLQPAEQIENQRQAVIGWLKSMLTIQTATCPNCGSTNTRLVEKSRPRPTFQCCRRQCPSTFSLLAGTALAHLGHPELWVEFLQGVSDGLGGYDLKRRSGLCLRTSTQWRRRFLLLIEEQGHVELLQWIKWIRSRRHKEARQLSREGLRLDMAKRSVYLQAGC